MPVLPSENIRYIFVGARKPVGFLIAFFVFFRKGRVSGFL